MFFWIGFVFATGCVVSYRLGKWVGVKEATRSDAEFMYRYIKFAEPKHTQSGRPQPGTASSSASELGERK